MVQSTVEYPKGRDVDVIGEAPIRVLHVDDEPGFLKAAKQILEMQRAFRVDTASSVEEAEEMMKQKSFDVIVSDYIMPGKDGLQFLKELRESGSKIPFIIFTGRGREIVAIRALNLGADLYVNKIGDPETVYSELAHGIRKLVEAKRAEEALQESEEKLRGIFSAMVDGVTLVGLDGRILDCNDAVLRLHDVSRDEYVNRSVYDFIAPEDRQRAIRQQRDVFEKGVFRSEVKALRKDGGTFDAEINVSLLRDASGEPIAFLGVTRNVTERKEIEERIRESKEKYRSLFENARDVVVLLDLKGNVTNINKAAVEYGFRKDEVIGKSIREFVPKRFWPKLFKELVQLSRGKAVKGQIEINTPKGKKDAEYASNPITINSKVVGVQTILRDVTERRWREEEIKKTSEEWKRTFDAISDFVYILDKDFRFVRVNRATCDALKRKPEELIGRRCFEMLHRTDKPWPNCPNQRTLVTKKAAIAEVNDPNLGMSLLVTTSPIFDDQGKLTGSVHIAKDITERKKAEEALRESKEKLRVMFESITDGVAIIDLKGNVVDANEAHLRMFGYTHKEELVGQSAFDSVAEKDRARAMEGMIKLFEEESSVPTEYTLRDKNGREFYAELTAALLRDSSGNPVGVVSVARDITERKKTLEKLKVLNEKLGVVGRLTRHDARNKLSTVTMNAFLIKQRLADDPEALKHLGEIELACREVEEIFDFARIYEKIGMEELAYMDAEKTLDETVRLFSDLQGVRVVNDCRGLTVLADSLLRQLFYNLIDNSLKHGGKVSQIRIYYEDAWRDRLNLVYEDNGIGVPKAEKERIFLEGYGKGTGYGLYLIRKMCEVYGWTIRETGKHGKGAQFTVTIPKTAENGKENYRFTNNAGS